MDSVASCLFPSGRSVLVFSTQNFKLPCALNPDKTSKMVVADGPEVSQAS